MSASCFVCMNRFTQSQASLKSLPCRCRKATPRIVSTAGPSLDTSGEDSSKGHTPPPPTPAAPGADDEVLLHGKRLCSNCVFILKPHASILIWGTILVGGAKSEDGVQFQTFTRPLHEAGRSFMRPKNLCVHQLPPFRTENIVRSSRSYFNRTSTSSNIGTV